MGFPAFVARLQIRRRWRSLVVLTIFVAVVGGIATALIAGARRSSSVVQRYFATTIPYRFQVGAQRLPRSRLTALPGVERADPEAYFGSVYVKPDGRVGAGINGTTYDRASIDPTIRVVAGRIPTQDDPSAVLVNEAFVQQFGLHPGDRLTVRTFALSDADAVQASHFDAPHGPEYGFRIAAVVRSPLDVALDEPHGVDPSSVYTNRSSMLVPAAFYDANRSHFLTFGDSYEVELAGSTSTRAFQSEATRAFGPGLYFGPARFAERQASFSTPVDLETAGLLALGGATGIAGAIVVALLLGAEQRSYADDDETLRGLGATRVQLATTATLRSFPFAVIGGVLGVALAVALSARFPIGVGHVLELDRGTSVNVAVLTTALFVAVAYVVAIASFLGFHTRRARRPATRAHGGTGRWLTRNGAPAEMAVGTHFAFSDDAGRSSGRTVVAGGAVALAVVVALGVFLAGIDHLYTNPAAHGWPWDAVIGNVNFTMSKARESAILHDPRVDTATRARYGQATVGGRSTEVLAYDPGGGAPPALLSGRLPTHADEIAPGAKLLEELHAHVGDRVNLSVADSEFASDSSRPVDRELTIVGVSLPPVMGESELGEVAVVPLSAIRAAGGITAPQLVLAQVRGNPVDAARGLAHDYTPDVGLDNVPARIVNLHRVRSLPLLGALLAAVFGTVLLAYTLAVAVRRRIRHLGVLRALGMSGRRVGRVLVWQGVALALAIVVVGLPLGVVLGAVVWRTFAHGLGVAPNATVPWSVLLLIPGSIVVGVLAAVMPAHRARRQHVSELLRVE
jgi:hypothetical protein